MESVLVFSRKAVLLLILSAIFNFATAQNSKKEKDSVKVQATRSQVESKRFVFQAQSASPMRGGRRNLTYGYTLLMSNDTIISDLPYYGRAYSAGYGSSDGGIKFTSTKFESTVTPRKKEGWDISVKPADVDYIEMLIITVHESGSATLQVKTRDRQPISFDGYIEEPKSRK
jgi:hypothetical protein